jgi:BASS family bile acid:Na+ symporter
VAFDTQLITKPIAILFVTSGMLSAGLSLMFGDVASCIRRGRLVAAVFGANFVAVPAVAWVITRIIPIQDDYRTGLILVSGAAGAPFLPKLAERAKTSIPFAVTMMLLLVVATVAFMPLIMPRILPGLTADPWRIAFPLIALIVVPLIAGMVIRAVWPRVGQRLENPIRKVSDISVLVLLVVVFATHMPAMWGALGTGAIFCALLLILCGGATGYAFGYGSEMGERRVLALGSAQRNVAAALVVAGTSYQDKPKVVVMILVTDIVAIIVLIFAAHKFRKAFEREPPAEVSAVVESKGTSATQVGAGVPHE